MVIVPVLILNGPVGVGKSTVALEISEILIKKNVSHGVIDLDYLRYAFPRPQTDPYAMELGYKNLKDVARNFQDAGIERFIIPTILEEEREKEKFRQAIPHADISVVRLKGSLSTIYNNLKQREIGMGLDWHLQRAEELSQQLDASQLENAVVTIDNKSVHEIAEEVLEKSNFESK